MYLYSFEKLAAMNPVNIHIKLVERTDLALLVSDGRKEVWVPLSQIEEVIEEPGLLGPEVTGIVVPEWLASDKGLQQVNQDDDTLDMFGDAS